MYFPPDGPRTAATGHCVIVCILKAAEPISEDRNTDFIHLTDENVRYELLAQSNAGATNTKSFNTNLLTRYRTLGSALRKCHAIV